jgi:microcystin-dependent protein
MSYIGNAKTPLLLASNVRDDLIPDGIKRVFELSQEVPGGEPINVCVVRRRWLTDTLIQSTNLVEFAQLNSTQSQIVVNDNFLAAALSIVTPRSQTGAQDGDYITIELESGFQTPSFKVDSITYTRDSITITLDGVVDTDKYVAVGTIVASIRRKYYGPWEILDPESQYEIISTSGFTNRKIEIKDLVPQTNDVLYVLHRGEGTYNFVPSPYSVGADQLALNLRSFATDSQDYTTTGEKTLSLSQTTPAASTLVVTVNGVVQISTNEVKQKNPSIDDEDNTGTWTLNEANGTSQTITLKASLFTTAASGTPVSVRVLHLTFSTISRRAAFSPTQEPKFIEAGSVTNIGLAQGSVTTEKVLDNSITGSKLLLLRDQSLRFQIQSSPSLETPVISLDQTNNETQLKSPGSVQIKPLNRTYTLSSTGVVPDTTNVASLGSSTNKFKDLHLSGTATASHVNATTLEVESITITGTIDNTDVSDLRNDVDELQTKVTEIIDFLIPIGTIVPSARVNPPVSTTYGTWIICDGRTLSRAQYPLLFNALGGVDLQANWPWGVCTDSLFAIPDLSRRVGIGKSTADTLGANEGEAVATSRALLHTHTGPVHTHTLTHTHDIPGHKHTITPLASGSIAITTNSGNHTTSISHAHSQVTTDSTSLDHYHQLTHSHGSASNPHTTTNNIGGRHGHSGRTNSTTSHGHSLGTTLRVEGARFSSNSSGGFSDFARAAGSGSTISISNESSHSHNVSVDEANITHYHQFWIDGQTDSSGGSLSSTAGIANNLSHTHTLSIPSSTLDSTSSSSSGEHVHGSTAFSGFIGTSLNAAEGNNPLTTTSQSTTTTSNPTASNTGPATLPHIIINYMIRAA